MAASGVFVMGRTVARVQDGPEGRLWRRSAFAVAPIRTRRHLWRTYGVVGQGRAHFYAMCAMMRPVGRCARCIGPRIPALVNCVGILSEDLAKNKLRRFRNEGAAAGSHVWPLRLGSRALSIFPNRGGCRCGKVRIPHQRRLGDAGHSVPW